MNCFTSELLRTRPIISRVYNRRHRDTKTLPASFCKRELSSYLGTSCSCEG